MPTTSTVGRTLLDGTTTPAGSDGTNGFGDVNSTTNGFRNGFGDVNSTAKVTNMAPGGATAAGDGDDDDIHTSSGKVAAVSKAEGGSALQHFRQQARAAAAIAPGSGGTAASE